MSKLVAISLDEILEQYFPASSHHFVRPFFDNNPFNFTVTTHRQSKKGDFRTSRNLINGATITVNGTLHQYEFLLVFLHELAHYFVAKEKPANVKPHGKEWKMCYKKLVEDALEQVKLPSDIVEAWRQHLKNIKSSSSTDPHLVAVFKKYDTRTSDKVMVGELQVGDIFLFRNLQFRVDSFARTRAKCTLLANNKQFLIGKTALVLKA
jgi:predicted SprT family Zn-dependent metalloprotease